MYVYIYIIFEVCTRIAPEDLRDCNALMRVPICISGNADISLCPYIIIRPARVRACVNLLFHYYFFFFLFKGDFIIYLFFNIKY